MLESATGAKTRLTIIGQGFEEGMRIEIGQREAETLEISPTEAVFSLPGNLLAGVYVVRVHWPDGTRLCSRWPLTLRQRSCQLRDVVFQRGSAELDTAADRTLAGNLSCLGHGEGRAIVVLGLASREGTEAVNLDLSKRRAQGVAARVSEHLPQSTVESVGLGNALPVNLGESERQLAPNRRATIVTVGGQPCQAVRLRIDAAGSLDTTSAGLLDGTAKCYADRSVTGVLVALPSPDGRASSSTPPVIEEIRKALRRRASSSVVATVQPAYASTEERAALARLFRTSAPPESGTYAELYPISWFTEPSAIALIETNDPSCPYEEEGAVEPVRDSQPIEAPKQLAPEGPRHGFFQVRLGSLFAFEHEHLGGKLRAGGQLAALDSTGSAGLLAGLDISTYHGDRAYRLADELSAHSIPRMMLVLGATHRGTGWRAEAALLGGVLLPAARALSTDVEGTLAVSIADNTELLGSADVGWLVFRDGETGRFWSANAGMGWWF